MIAAKGKIEREVLLQNIDDTSRGLIMERKINMINYAADDYFFEDNVVINGGINWPNCSQSLAYSKLCNIIHAKYIIHIF